MAAEWFYQVEGQELGPVDSRELRRLAEAGVVRPDTLVRQGTSSRWVRAEQVRGVFQRPTPAPSPSLGAPPPPPLPLPSPVPESGTTDTDFDPYHLWLGIHPAKRPLNHYILLGIGEYEGDPEVIANAADRQMAHLRTCQAGEHVEASQKLLNEVAGAKVCLLDPTKKAAYDRALQQAQPPIPPPVPRLSISQVRQEAELARRRRADRDREPKPTGMLMFLGAMAATWKAITRDRRRRNEQIPKSPWPQAPQAQTPPEAVQPASAVVPPAGLRTRGVHGHLPALLIALSVLVVVSLPLGLFLAEIGSYLAEKESVDAPQETDWEAILTQELGPAPSRPRDYVPPQSAPSASVKPGLGPEWELVGPAPPQSAPSASVKPGLTDDRVGRIIERAAAHVNAGELDKAIAECSEAIRLDPNNWVAYCVRGLAYRDKGDYDQAIADFTVLIRLNPKDTTGYCARGIAYREKGEYDQAIADFTEAIQLDSQDSTTYRNRGLAFLGKDDYDMAIADCTEAIRLHPKEMLAYWARGRAYANKGEYDQAIADFAAVIRLDPENWAAYCDRGRAYAEKGDYDTAIADYTEAIRLDPENARAYSSRGLAYYSEGDQDKAIADFTEAIRLDPKDADAYYSRGEAYQAKGQRAAAEKDFARAKRLGCKLPTPPKAVDSANPWQAEYDAVTAREAGDRKAVDSAPAVDWGQGNAQRKAMLAQVGPSVVQVRQEDSFGSGFVVGVNKGSAIIATNYHVIEGAKRIAVLFPTDKDKRMYWADGYIAVLPRKDLALVHVNLGEKKVEALELAESDPEQDDMVYTIGSSLGLGNTHGTGFVSGVRSGREVADLLGRLRGKGEYMEVLAYDLDATWIQHSAHMSSGNSGGPLVNTAGEVVGVNTIASENLASKDSVVQEVNFAISAIHLKRLIDKAGTNIQAFASLPPPRNCHQIEVRGNGRSGVYITLPSGAVLTEAMLEVPPKWEEKLFRQEKRWDGELRPLVVVAEYPDGSVQGRFTLGYKGGRDGASATFHENHQLHSLALYSNGKLHGYLKLWGENGERVLYAEYKFGKKDGLVCLFRDGVPWLIEEWKWQDQESAQSRCVVKWTKDRSDIVPNRQPSDDRNAAVSEILMAVRQLAALEETIEQNEKERNVQLLKWFRRKR